MENITVNTIVDDDTNEALKIINDQFKQYMLWGVPIDNRTEEEKYIDSLKMAYVFVQESDKRHTALRVSNIDNKGYKYKDYYETILPLEEVSYFSFERWWRSMDF